MMKKETIKKIIMPAIIILMLLACIIAIDQAANPESSNKGYSNMTVKNQDMIKYNGVYYTDGINKTGKAVKNETVKNLFEK